MDVFMHGKYTNYFHNVTLYFIIVIRFKSIE